MCRIRFKLKEKISITQDRKTIRVDVKTKRNKEGGWGRGVGKGGGEIQN